MWRACCVYFSTQAFYWPSQPLKERMFYLRRGTFMLCPEVQEAKKLDKYVSNWGKMRLAVPRDGHCILYAFILGLKELGVSNTVEELVPKVKSEVMANIDFYSPFVGDTDLVAELDDYLESKVYNSGLVDLMLHVLANITEMSLLVFYTHMDCVRNLLVPPKQGRSRQMIHMAKLGQHYDAILNVSTIKCEKQDESASKDYSRFQITFHPKVRKFVSS